MTFSITRFYKLCKKNLKNNKNYKLISQKFDKMKKIILENDSKNFESFMEFINNLLSEEFGFSYQFLKKIINNYLNKIYEKNKHFINNGNGKRNKKIKSI